MVIEIVVSLVVGFATGFYVTKFVTAAAVAKFKAELDKVIAEAETLGKSEVASVLNKFKAKL